MKLGDYTPAEQTNILGRAWAAIGIKADTVTDEMLEDWQQKLAHLTLEQIKIGIDQCKARSRTAHADEFVTLCQAQPEPAPPPAVRVQSEPPAGREETREESYNALGLPARWGPLPRAAK